MRISDWSSDVCSSDLAALFNVTDVDPEGRSRVVTMAWSFAAKTARVLDTLAESAQAIGPLGGQLSSEGYGDRRELVEAMTGGARPSYGDRKRVVWGKRGAVRVGLGWGLVDKKK